MYAKFSTKKKAQEVLKKINDMKSGSREWLRDGITEYATLIELEDGYALPILPGYQYYFSGIPQRKKESLKLKISQTLI